MNDAPTTHPAVSAAICTRNRSDKIGTAVASVLANDYPSFDLTVVDQSTDDRTREIIAEIAETDDRVSYVKMETSGLSKAYNTAIRSTSADILVFTDDDCIAPSDWISTIVDVFEREPECGLLYGQVVPAFPDDDGVALTPFLQIDHVQRFQKGTGLTITGMGANYAARRSMLDTAGMFDEVLGGGGPLKSSQDFDLAYRCYQSGVAIVLHPDVVMRHDGRREREDWPTLLENYGIGDGAFYTKHIRCRDPYALWLFGRRLVVTSTKYVVKRLLRRPVTANHYIRGMVKGARGSFGFDVDRAARLYVPATETETAK